MRCQTPNKRPGADAGWRVLFAFQHPRPRAAQAECKQMKTSLLLSLLVLMCLTGCCSGVKARSPSAQKRQNADLVEVGKAQYERGDLQGAAKTLSDCLRADPQNGPARYYLNLVREAEYQKTLDKRDPGRRFWYPTAPHVLLDETRA